MGGGMDIQENTECCGAMGLVWRGSLLPLGGEAAPKPFIAVAQVNCGARFTTAAQPSGSQLPRHKCFWGSRLLPGAPMLLQILALRQEKAKLLGFAQFADLVTIDRMAKTGAAAEKFLTDLKEKTVPFFERENAQLKAFAGGIELEPWDVGYYAEKQRVALYDFDEEQLRPYFSLAGAMAGMFELTGKLFGIRVVARAGVPGWDKDVQYFDIFDSASNEPLASFYADIYPW